MRYDSRQHIEDIEVRLGKIEVVIDAIHLQVTNHIPAEISKLKGRPSWMILGTMAFLTSLITLLLSIVLRR